MSAEAAKPQGFNLLAFRGKMKVLHMSWMAFFVTFVVWFNHAPLMSAIKDTLGLSKAEVSTLLTLNVALAIPARIIIGMLTDKFGPRQVYSILLIVCSLPCFAFALADSFAQAAIARFLVGFVGAGFVVGIRMVGEWFRPTNLAAPRACTAAGGTSARPLRRCLCRRWPCCSAATRVGATPSA